VVLISGTGTNLQAVLDACESHRLDAEVVAVVSNRADAGGLERARTHGVEGVVVSPEPGEIRTDYDTRLAEVVSSFQPDWVVLAGFMRLLSMRFLERFPNRVVNVHPALPGDLPGVAAIERAHREGLEGRRNRTGVMVHLVPDEGIDSGPPVVVEEVALMAGESLHELEQRMHAVEHRLLVEALRRLISSEDGGS
jgi:phosphoribosylglycinamide formyltransferase-1